MQIDTLPKGVIVRRLTEHSDNRGALAEIHRADWTPSGAFLQWNLVRSLGNVLRGVHVHPKHADYLLVLSGTMLLGLHDLRPEDPLARSSLFLTLSGTEPTTVYIPPGVCHGFWFAEPTTYIHGLSSGWKIVLKLAQLHAQGFLGKTLHLQSWRLGWHSHDKTSDSIWHLMPHDLSITLEILGHLPRVRQASGYTAFGVHSEAMALLQDDAGPSVGLHVSGCQPITRRSVLLVGSEGSAQFGGSYDDRIQIRWQDGRTEDIAIATDMPLLTELSVFLDHIRGGPAPKSPAPEAAAIVRHIADIRAMAGLAPR